MNEDLIKVVNWAHSIGLDVKEGDDSLDNHVTPFLDNIWIIDGVVWFNELTHPGDLLHDLGHVAVTPSNLRSYLTGDLDIYEISEAVKEIDRINYDSSQWFALAHGDEQATIAWSFAAAQAAGVDDSLPFKNGFEAAFQYVSTGANIHSALQMSCGNALALHPGISCLYHGKMLAHKADFPNLAKWIQD